MSRWAVVLGGSTGSGASIAKSLASSPGCDIYICHRGNHVESAQEVRQAVHSSHQRFSEYIGNVATADGAQRAADELLQLTGVQSIGILVHSLASASIGRLASADSRQLSSDQIQRTFDVMCHSFIYWVQALLERDLLAPNARILGLTNPLDESLIKDCGLIAATKGALHAYVRALALELGPKGHRVNLLKFSTVITPAVEKVYGEDAIEHLMAVHNRLLPAGRMCTTEEVGKLVSFLATPEADYFNGAVIDFSGSMALGMADILLRGQRD